MKSTARRRAQVKSRVRIAAKQKKTPMRFGVYAERCFIGDGRVNRNSRPW